MLSQMNFSSTFTIHSCLESIYVFQNIGLDGFRRIDENEGFLEEHHLQVVEGNRGPGKDKIDGFVLSSNLTIERVAHDDIFHQENNPRTVRVDTTIFIHNPISLKVGASDEETNEDSNLGPSQDEGELEKALEDMSIKKE